MALKGLEISTSRPVPDWLSLNKEGMKGTVMRIPSMQEIQPIANVQAVVEFYSR
jgi:small subunit ribosomal protein S4